MEYFEFYWKVPESGFECRTARPYDSPTFGADTEDFIAERAKLGEAVTYNNYPALKKSGLFQTFAQTGDTVAGVLGFANKYGFLYEDRPDCVMAEPVEGKLNTYLPVHAEPLRVWFREMNSLRGALQLWEGCRESSAYNSDQCSIDPNWSDLQKTINRYLKQLDYDPMLLWDRGSAVPKLRSRLVPRNLLGAMWLQFAAAVEGNLTYRKCEQCPNWFEVLAEKREDARFCSNACRFRAYRGRQKEARGLRAKGNSLKSIAAHLGSDIPTVRRWVGESKEK